jgi:hypothetical protein
VTTREQGRRGGFDRVALPTDDAFYVANECAGSRCCCSAIHHIILPLVDG